MLVSLAEHPCGGFYGALSLSLFFFFFFGFLGFVVRVGVQSGAVFGVDCCGSVRFGAVRYGQWWFPCRFLRFDVVCCGSV